MTHMALVRSNYALAVCPSWSFHLLQQKISPEGKAHNGTQQSLQLSMLHTDLPNWDWLRAGQADPPMRSSGTNVAGDGRNAKRQWAAWFSE